MSGSDDSGWNWWEVFDIITTIDDELERLNKVADKQLEALEKLAGNTEGINGEGGSEVVDVTNLQEASSAIASPITARSFQQSESEEDVEIEPDSNEDILKVDVKNSGLWYEVGSHDQTHSGYQYYVDDTELLDSRQAEPLGLYNDPYRFPQPIIVHDKIAVNVKRYSGASGPAEYFSKVRYLPISDQTAEKLENIWRSI